MNKFHIIIVLHIAFIGTIIIVLHIAFIQTITHSNKNSLHIVYIESKHYILRLLFRIRRIIIFN